MEPTGKLNAVVTLNAATELGRRVVAMRKEGIIVVNAPRPIPGNVVWNDDFHHGRFYATGSLTNTDLFPLWKSDDAYEVIALTDAEIEDRFRKAYDEMGSDYEVVAARYEEIGMDPHIHMARSFDLPHSSLWDPSARGRRQ